MSDATLQLSNENEVARLAIPWANGTWSFSGKQKPVAGTLVIVEEDEAGTNSLVGTCTSFYDLSLNEPKK